MFLRLQPLWAPDGHPSCGPAPGRAPPARGRAAGPLQCPPEWSRSRRLLTAVVTVTKSTECRTSMNRCSRQRRAACVGPDHPRVPGNQSPGSPVLLVEEAPPVLVLMVPPEPDSAETVHACAHVHAQAGVFL
nr:uncharacterized protein LOC123276931 isoform X7 [Equus asinus]